MYILERLIYEGSKAYNVYKRRKPKKEQFKFLCADERDRERCHIDCDLRTKRYLDILIYNRVIYPNETSI